MLDSQPPALKSDYYAENFHKLAGFVATTYDDLLDDTERQWYEAICSVSKQAQLLYIRLITRQGEVFRISRLNYPEIDNRVAAAEELASLGLGSCQPPGDLVTLLAGFTKPEIIEVLELKSYSRLSRVDLIAYILESDEVWKKRSTLCLQKSDLWLTLHGHAHWTLMQLCFFGNLYQDSSEFVLSQLGTLRYESYPLDRAARAFATREQIHAHLRFYECVVLYEHMDIRNAEQILQLAQSLPKAIENDQALRRRLDRLHNRLARQLERLSCIQDALALYEKSEMPPARERRIRCMMHLEQWTQALTLAGETQKTAYNEAEKLIALKLYKQCQKALGQSVLKEPGFKPATSKLVLCKTEHRVEEIARAYFALKGECFYTENALVNGVLGLFIWDIVFYPIPGVFFNPFQVGPADFNSPAFYRQRCQLIKDRYKELDDPVKFHSRVWQAYSAHQGKLNPLVRWGQLTPELLATAIERISAAHWQAMFTRILSDPRENSAGFPDLILFAPTGGYEFIEIKGPGDSLQANQRRWMQYFDSHGIACRLVHIRYRAGNQ